MASEKIKPADISTETANTGSREANFHTVSPVSPLFAEDSHETEGNHTSASQSTAAEETPPPKPPRPLDPQQQAELTLAEAFPSVEASVIKAVLIASRGELEPAFNALLAMSDPTYVPEEPPVPTIGPAPRSKAYSPRMDSRFPPPQRSDYNPAHVYQDRIDLRGPPSMPHTKTVTPRNQLEADEIYARQLAEHYNNAGRQRGRGGQQNRPPARPQHRREDSEDNYNEEKEYSFLDDDLPVIKENIRQGFLQTQSKVNQWVAELKKKIDGEPTSPELPPAHHDPRVDSVRGVGRGGPSRGGPVYSSYDADPRVLSDDFTHLELRDSSQDEVPPKRPPRPVANPKLFQSSGNTSKKVSFQEVTDEDLYRPPPPRQPSTGAPKSTAKQPSPPSSKWQPLKSVEPTPLDGDPFSLGDSEDERDHGLVPEPKVEPENQTAPGK